MTSDWNRNIEESLDAFYAAHEVLKKEIKEGPAFVREIYETLQRMGYLRLEARALMLDVRNEILDQNSGVLDPEEYERELHLLTKKPYDLYDVPLVCDAELEQLGDRIRDFYEKTEEEEAGADELALEILPELEACVRNSAQGHRAPRGLVRQTDGSGRATMTIEFAGLRETDLVVCPTLV